MLHRMSSRDTKSLQVNNAGGVEQDDQLRREYLKQPVTQWTTHVRKLQVRDLQGEGLHRTDKGIPRGAMKTLHGIEKQPSVPAMPRDH